MPEGKINEIKTKRFLRKRTTIQAADDFGSGLSHISDVGFIEGEVDVARDIMDKEKLLRNRSTILDSSGLIFSNILSILSQIKASEDGRINETSVPNKYSAITQVNRSSGRQHTYSRYYQEQQPTKDVSGFEIDTTGTYRIQKSTASDSFKFQQGSVISGKSEEERQSGSKRESRTPIIIVPAALTAVITLQNAKEFLQDDKYMAMSDIQIQSVGDILIQRRKVEPGTSKFFTAPYRIIDSPAKLRQNDWNRVVAVFVAGPQWQFKGWPGLAIDGSPVEIFVKICAFHLKFLESPLETNIQKWNVTVLEISKTKRHLDKVAVNKFWEITDKSMSHKIKNSNKL
ncbi:hypothetical protein LOD99_808 [Oopsacas minuta]|uniref:Parafibromin n=1 Tax=Oopsacas minuta TaxID=111878 RepID=A0AAV7JZQ9_9METZ|nr:hypothetical protein LOD99_808 [Oopsacas minuta]